MDLWLLCGVLASAAFTYLHGCSLLALLDASAHFPWAFSSLIAELAHVGAMNVSYDLKKSESFQTGDGNVLWNGFPYFMSLAYFWVCPLPLDPRSSFISLVISSSWTKWRTLRSRGVTRVCITQYERSLCHPHDGPSSGWTIQNMLSLKAVSDITRLCVTPIYCNM